MKSSLNLSRRLMQVLAVTLLACSQFFFFGCSSDEEDTTPSYTLTLYSKYGCGTLSPDKTSIQIKEGEVLTAYKPTVTPEPGTFFIEWQDADGNPFNFDQKITSDLTAYARYVSDIKEFKMVSHGLFTFKQSNSYVPFIAEDYSLYAVSGAVETPLTFTVTETIQSYYPTVKVYNLTVEDFESTVDQGSYDFVLKNCRTEKSISSTIDYSHTVTFKMNNCTYQSSSTYTQRVEKGETATSITPDSIDTGYVFYGWLDSHGNPFDFSTVITDDITLTAKILPVITKVETSGTNSIKVYSAVYKLTKNDITATYTSSTYPEGKTLTLTYQAIGTTTYTCTAFESSDFDFEFETHFTVSVSNGVDTITSEDGYIAPPPTPTDLSVTVEDRGLTFSWTKASGYSYCDYEVYDSSDKQILSGTKYSSSSLFCNKLTNGQEYTFKIKTRSDYSYDFFSETVSISGTPAIVKKDVEYLMLMYLDGDNNLHDGIYLDLNEMEYGIYKSRLSASLEVIALWDGFVGDSETTPQLGSSGSKLYKVGKESSASTTYVNSTGCVLGSNTYDISYTADWLSTGEVDMSSKQTLINFLNWANAHYNAQKIVLQFSDHGGGPRAARPEYVTLKNGMKYKIPSGNERRSMCWDQGSGGKSFLKTSDVSSALNQAGFGTDKKLLLIIEDLCLGGSLEEAYQFKDYAYYYLGSPNNVPGLGLPYEKVIPNLTTLGTSKNILSKIIDDYRAEYKRSATDWKKLLTEITTNYPSLGVTENNLSLFDFDAYTLTAVDLTKMDAVKAAVDAYAQEILDNDNQEIAGLYFDKSAREITKTASTTTVPLTYGRIIQDSALYRGGLLSYMGSYTWLFEFGAVLDNSYNLATELTVGETTYTWPDLADKVLNVAAALDDCIIASWRDGNLSSGLYYNYYPQYSTSKTRSGILESGFYGLSISGGTVEMSVSGSNATLLPEKNPDWYKTELAFGKDSKWGDLLEYWFGDN